MSSDAPVSPPRPAPSRASWSKPELARMILAATASVVGATLAIWLLAWILLYRPGSIAAGWVAPSGIGAPVLPFQEQDASRFGRGLTNGSTPDVPLKGLANALADAALPRSRRPLVVYLSAPGLDVDGHSYFMAGDESAFIAGRGGPDSLTSVEALLESWRNDPGRKKLLILDAAQVGTDRHLGLFGNGFVHRLQQLLDEKKPPNLVVLSSCAPGQTSWVSEADQRSVFGEFVARGLAGEAASWDPSGRVTVQGLARFVAHHVERWARTQRQAVQTPILLGDTTLNFAITQIGAPASTAPPEADEKADEALRKAFTEAWETRDRLAERTPWRYAPLLWSGYLAGLLHAERLERAGLGTAAQRELATLRPIAEKIAQRSAGPRLATPYTLALGRRYGDDALRAEVERASQSLDKALASLTGQQALEQAIRDEGRKADSPPADPPVPDQPEAGVPKGEPAARPDKPAEGLDRLVQEKARHVPRYAEAQLVVWADLFQSQPGAPAWEGRRGENLQRGVDLRRRLEEIAAAGEPVATGLSAAFQRADAQRRLAQDLVFSSDPADLQPASEALDRAEELLGQTRAELDLRLSALDKLEQVIVELPYLAEWRSRREPTSRDDSCAAILTQAVKLARLLDRPPSSGGSADEGAAQRELADARAALAGFDALRREFLSQCDLAASPNVPSSWREIDDLLRVPLIPAARRAALLGKLRDARLNAPLEGSSPAPASTEAAPTRGEPDPLFWSEAIVLGEVECGLMELGGLDGEAVASLRRELEAVRSSRTHASVAFDHLAAFNKQLRAARRALRERVASVAAGPDPAQGDDAIERTLVAADRAARVLRVADIEGIPEQSAPDWQLARFQRYAQLRRLGRRLAEDGSPEPALAALGEARSQLDTPAVRADQEQAQRIARSALVLAATPGDDLSIGTEDARLSVRPAMSGTLPEGMAALLLGFDRSQPLSIDLAPSEPARAPQKALVAVPPPAEDERTFVLRRMEYSDQPVRLDLVPALFYRGRIFPTASPIRVAFAPAEEEVTVDIRDRDFSGARDQFRYHPGRGYLHYGATLRYRLVLTNKKAKDVKVWVSYGLDGQSPRTATLVLKPGVPNQDLEGRILAVDLGQPASTTDPKGDPAKPPAPPPRAGDDEVAVGQPRFLTVIVRENGPEGRALAMTRKYEFHQMDIRQYASAFAQFDPGRGRLRVIARHLATDRVTGPLQFSAVIAGNPIAVPTAVKGEFAWFDWYFPLPWPEKVQWSVTAGLKDNAFSGVTETHVAPPVPPPGPQPDGPKL